MAVPMHPERREALAVSRNDIGEIIGEYVPFLVLLPAGVRLFCPLHYDHIGTLFVDRQAQTFTCRAEQCGAHGDVIDFIAQYERVSRAQATEWLLERIGCK